MPFFKAPDNSLHFLDTTDIARGVVRVDGAPTGENHVLALLPAGCVGITDAEAEALRSPPEAWEHAKLRALELLRIERAPILTVLDGLQSTSATKGLAALLAGESAAAATHAQMAQEIEVLKQGLKDAPAAIDWETCATYEDMRQAGKAYYAALVEGADPDVLNAFRAVR